MEGPKKRAREGEEDDSTYIGEFTHPAFGTYSVSLVVKMASLTWTAEGIETRPIVVERDGTNIHMRERDGLTALEGKLDKQGNISGIVIQSGVRGGSFCLKKEQSDSAEGTRCTRSKLQAPHVTIVATGGTIDKAYPRLTKGWAFEIADPAAERIFERITPPGFTFSVVPICAKDSQEVTDADRESMLQACIAAEGKWLIVTHGTDTMVETAQYLGKQHHVKMPGKTICITGAMRPERMVDTDAHFNMGVTFGALNMATPGVYLCMGGIVHPWDNVHRDLSTGSFVKG